MSVIVRTPQKKINGNKRGRKDAIIRKIDQRRIAIKSIKKGSKQYNAVFLYLGQVINVGILSIKVYKRKISLKNIPSIMVAYLSYQ